MADSLKMASLIVQALVLYVTLIVLWKVLRWLFVKSPLESIPGPPALSFISGKLDDFILMASPLIQVVR